MVRSYYSVAGAFAGLLALLLAGPSCSDDPVKRSTRNEKIYINEIYAADGTDWIELYNDSDEAKDIAGFRIYDDASNKYILPSASIAPKGFLVLFCDDMATGLHTNFRLSATGEVVVLENAHEEVVDRVEFPALGGGQSYGRYPDGGASIGVSGNVSQGFTNGEVQAPVIGEVSRTPVVPGLNEPVTISTTIVSNSGISSVKLFYRKDNGSFSSVTMTASQGSYTGVIPGFGTTGLVEYYIEVKNSTGLTSLSPFDAPSGLYNFLLNTDALPQLVINEFMAANVSCCPDASSGQNEFDDWVEIYNAGANSVDVGGFYVSDNLDNPFKFQIPNSTTIPPGGFLLLWADENGSQGNLHMNFRLGAEGEAIGLFYKDGRTIHSYVFGAQTPDTSWGLIDDGGATWKQYTTPTPGTSND